MNGPLGIMFHHFHGQGHLPGQGSISQHDFKQILEYLKLTYDLLPAKEYLNRAQDDSLGSSHACLTFDDSLRCQYDLAMPVLSDLGLTAFWFVYTSPMAGHVERLEVYRHFRNSCYEDIEDFYSTFFRAAETTFGTKVIAPLAAFSPQDYLSDYPFYSTSDRIFRYLRDQVLSAWEYDRLMDDLIAASGQDLSAISEALWMKVEHLQKLHQQGHVIGLHSHSHPMNMERLTEDEQHQEYATNHRILTEILGEPPTTMSHPCNRYTGHTLSILTKLGITLGFRADTAPSGGSHLEHPREDHSNIARSLAQ
ncbi:polysaccharide deacetylase family protein [Desulfovibrio ferrophilus]|uniref:NodB homology domain-containing protein n=1 Tax=Desulfovibrio ferrophilus TaxID=241368 RepID=A0A2Z6B1B7_9BACT|nr:polysaccharide deacetylase family protein [Desulfovibrio ferrophilus]BBD09317.1 uncharacterized protein DFE_2591 [Desulfovibrio ferrophilus]